MFKSFVVDNQKEPFDVDYFIVLSRKFTEEESELDKEDSRPSKKRNAKVSIFCFCLF